MPAKEKTVSEEKTIEVGNALPQPLGSAWWINGWTRAGRVSAALACYPRLATERISGRIFRAKKREAAGTPNTCRDARREQEKT